MLIYPKVRALLAGALLGASAKRHYITFLARRLVCEVFRCSPNILTRFFESYPLPTCYRVSGIRRNSLQSSRYHLPIPFQKSADWYTSETIIIPIRTGNGQNNSWSGYFWLPLFLPVCRVPTAILALRVPGTLPIPTFFDWIHSSISASFQATVLAVTTRRFGKHPSRSSLHMVERDNPPVLICTTGNLIKFDILPPKNDFN